MIKIQSVLLILFTLVVILKADDNLCGAGYYAGLGYNQSWSGSFGLELLHTSSVNKRLKYNVIGFPSLMIIQDPYNNNDLNASFGFIGLFDFGWQFTAGPVHDIPGIAMALLSGRILWSFNDYISIVFENSLQPVIFRPTKWWQESVGGGMQIGIKQPQKSNGEIEDKYHIVRIVANYRFNVLYPEQGLSGFAIQYEYGFFGE